MKNLHAQKSYFILYDYPVRDYFDYKNTYEFLNSNQNQLKLVINDSIQFSYLIRGRDLGKKFNNVYGNNFIPYNSYYSKNSLKYYSYINLKGKSEYLKESDLEKRLWIDAESEKNILGYKCKSAFSVNTKNDSTFIYYTDLLGISGAPLANCYNIHGLILEVFDQEKNIHILAKKINQCDCKIIFPTSMEVLNELESQKRIEKVKAEFLGNDFKLRKN